MIIIDACVAAKWFLPEPSSDSAEALLLETVPRFAPEHISVEVGNVLLKAYRANSVTVAHARTALSVLPELIQLLPTRELAVPALEIAHAIGCTNYHALYVAAAERLDAELVTADAKLARQLESAQWQGQCRLLGA